MNARVWCGAIILTAIGANGIAVAQAQSTAPAAPPQIKQTVDAFAGHWDLAATDTEPGAQPVQFKVTMDFKTAALGAAVSGDIAGEFPGAGPIAASCVIGYSPDEQVVRWMEISSTGEYHDHKGTWKGQTLEFEPLTFTIGGQKATEYLSVGFPSAGKMALHSVTETAQGRSILDCTGTRSKSKS